MTAPLFAPPQAVTTEHLHAAPGAAIAIYDVRDGRRLTEGFLVFNGDRLIVRSGGVPPVQENSYDPRHIMVMATEHVKAAPKATAEPMPGWNRFQACAAPTEPAAKPQPEIRGII